MKLFNVMALVVTASLACTLTVGCVSPSSSDASGSQQSASDKAAESSSDKVADSSEMTEIEEANTDSMTPIFADQLNDGTYAITVDSSSSMFRIASCEITVKDGKMEAAMTMGGKGYLYLYPGTAEEAAAANESDYITYTENAEGAQVYTLPIEALDTGVNCAAFSKNKEKWYPRTLVFEADQLPAEAFKPGVLTLASSLGLADGTYKADVALVGGTGRATVESPATLTVSGGEVKATIVWSSPNYDYMIVDDTRYNPINEGGNSTFEFPVHFFDFAMGVVADTTAMSEPHEIAYQLNFDSHTITPA